MFVGTVYKKKIIWKNLLYLKQFTVAIANIFITCRYFLKIFSILLDALAHTFLLFHHQCLLKLLHRNWRINGKNRPSPQKIMLFRRILWSVDLDGYSLAQDIFNFLFWYDPDGFFIIWVYHSKPLPKCR